LPTRSPSRYFTQPSESSPFGSLSPTTKTIIEYAAIGLTLASLFVYTVLFSIECGAPLFLWKPHLFSGNRAPRKNAIQYIAPLWEATNVFLVFAIVSFIAFFPGAVPIWGAALIVPFFIFLAVMGLRTLGMLYFAYHGGTSPRGALLLFLINLAAPAVLVGGTVPFFLTGSAVPSWETAWYGALAVVTTLLISLSFFDYLARRNSAALFRFIFILLVVGIVFFGTAAGAMPYLIYPSLTLSAAFTDPLSAKILFIVFLVGAAIVIPCLLWLYRLFLGEKL
jgi:cytochrome bd-type quinol oxidase subunit 2